MTEHQPQTDGPRRLPTLAGEVEERFAGTGPERVRYAERGQGRPVVLIHGALTCLEDMLLGPFDLLAERFRTVAVDRPGLGLTARARLQGGPSPQAERIRVALKEIGVERPILVGHSRGGAVALAFALARPEALSGLVLLAPQFLPEPRTEQWLFGGRVIPGAGEAFSATGGRILDAALLPLIWERLFAPRGMPEPFRSRFPFAMATRPETMTATGEEAVQFLPELARNALLARGCRLPARVLAGDADLVINPYLHAMSLGAVLPGGSAILLRGVGHMLQHHAPDAVAQAVQAVSDAS